MANVMPEQPYELVSTPEGIVARVRLRGRSVLSIPLLNRGTAFTLAEREALGLTGMFAAVVTASDLGIAKPDPRIFRHAASQLGVPPERCVFVGDLRDTDALGAAAVGMIALMVM